MTGVTVHRCEQRSPEWHQARVGRLTGSRAADMMSKGRSGAESAGRRNLRVQLVLERINGRPQEPSYTSRAMQAGIDREPDAYAAYEALTGTLLDRVGFLSHDTMLVGASLDGQVSDFSGLIEIKCPLDATHLEYLKTGRVPGEYRWQVTHALWLTGAEWCDWFSYHPDFPEPVRIKLVRIERNQTEIDAYELAVRAFLSEVDREVEELQAIIRSAA